MDIAGKEAAAVDEARQKNGCADNGLLGVNITAVLARRHGSHAFTFVGAVHAAEILWQGLDRLRRQHGPARISQFLLALQPLVELCLVGKHADRPHERIIRHRDAGHVLRGRFDAVQVPVHDVGIGKHIPQNLNPGTTVVVPNSSGTMSSTVTAMESPFFAPSI